MGVRLTVTALTHAAKPDRDPQGSNGITTGVDRISPGQCRGCDPRGWGTFYRLAGPTHGMALRSWIIEPGSQSQPRAMPPDRQDVIERSYSSMTPGCHGVSRHI